MTIPERNESHEDESVSYNSGLQAFDLIPLMERKLQQPYEFKAYIEGRGIVVITNKKTIKGVPKIKEGNNLKTLPDAVIYLTPELFSELCPTNDKNQLSLRRIRIYSRAPITDAQTKTKAAQSDIRELLKKV